MAILKESIPDKNDLIKKAGDLKVLPFVARKMVDTIEDPGCSITHLGEIIEKDQTVSARVLKISNSALYGLRQEVTSLQHALMILGIKTIRSLVMSVSTKSLYKQFGITEKIIWDHSVGAAIAAKMIATGLGNDVEEVAFIGGLMHDMGKVVLNNETPDVFAKVMMKSYNEGVNSIDAEMEIYGYDHTEIGAMVVKKWGFPNILSQILGKHHLANGSLEKQEDPLYAKGIACINLADNICKFLGIGFRKPDDTILLQELSSAKFLGITDNALNHLAEQINETFENEKSVFD